MEENNRLIAEFDGWIYISNAVYKNDLYEAGDNAGEWETTDIYVKNPSKDFLKQKKFGSYASEDYYDDKNPYDEYKWNLNYNKNWDLIIPIVNKIEQLNEGIPQQLINLSLFSTLSEVYEGCISFIKWYNKQK